VFVDNLLQVAKAADLRASSLIPTGVSYIYLSNTIPIGNGTRGMPIGRSVWTVNVDTDLTSASPPCTVDFKVISGDNGDLLTDLLAGTYNIHYETTYVVVSGTPPVRLLEFVIDPGLSTSYSRYRKYLGVFATFSGGGLSDGSWTIQATMDASVTPTVYPADALPN
jgi:hypothetical protein